MPYTSSFSSTQKAEVLLIFENFSKILYSLFTTLTISFILLIICCVLLIIINIFFLITGNGGDDTKTTALVDEDYVLPPGQCCAHVDFGRTTSRWCQITYGFYTKEQCTSHCHDNHRLVAPHDQCRYALCFFLLSHTKI